MVVVAGGEAEHGMERCIAVRHGQVGLHSGALFCFSLPCHSVELPSCVIQISVLIFSYHKHYQLVYSHETFPFRSQSYFFSLLPSSPSSSFPHPTNHISPPSSLSANILVLNPLSPPHLNKSPTILRLFGPLSTHVRKIIHTSITSQTHRSFSLHIQAPFLSAMDRRSITLFISKQRSIERNVHSCGGGEDKKG